MDRCDSCGFIYVDAAALPARLTAFGQRSERPVLWIGQHTVHEGEHHLQDIQAGLAHLRSTAG
jgi:hypothetical protein